MWAGRRSDHVWFSPLFSFCLFVFTLFFRCVTALLKRFTVDLLVGCTALLLCVCVFLCHMVLAVILLHFLLVFIRLCFLLHLRADFLSLFLLSNSIHERRTLHHSVSLYLCPPFIFSTPFCSGARWREREGGLVGVERNREGGGGGEMDRLGDSDKQSISRPNSPGRISLPPSLLPSFPPLYSFLLLFPHCPLIPSSSVSSFSLTFVPFNLTRVH